MAQEISLNDKYAILLQKTVDENRSLCEQIQKGGTESAKKLEILSERVENLTRKVEDQEGDGRVSRRSKTAENKPRTPGQCRVRASSILVC